MFKIKHINESLRMGLPLFALLSAGSAHALTITGNFTQTYIGGNLYGNFQGKDSNNDRQLSANELTLFSQSFQDDNSMDLFTQDILSLNSFTYDIESNILRQLTSSSVEDINDGTIDKKEYEVNAFGETSSGTSTVKIKTFSSDGTTAEEQFDSDSPIDVTASMTDDLNFLLNQDYNGIPLEGMFGGNDSNENGFLTLDELSYFEISFNDQIGNISFQQQLGDLRDFNFDIEALDLLHFFSTSIEDINDGTIDSITYTVNGSNDPNVQSTISALTAFTDGNLTTNDISTDAPIVVDGVLVPVDTPEPGNVLALVALGGAVCGWKRSRR